MHHTKSDLRRRARQHYPQSRRLAAKWVLAAMKLEKDRGGFITEIDVAKPSWSYRADA